MTLLADSRAALLTAAYPHGGAVVGLGIDLCEIERIEEALERHGPRFLDRICVPGEVRRPLGSRRVAEHVAGLFAAKEAAMKALGTGMRGVAFREIAVARSGMLRCQFPLALNDAVGAWKIEATDVLTGTRGAATFAVRSPIRADGAAR